MRVFKDASVTGGAPCPKCGRPAIFVVEDRLKYKCGDGDRWARTIDQEDDRSVL